MPQTMFFRDIPTKIRTNVCGPGHMAPSMVKSPNQMEYISRRSSCPPHPLPGQPSQRTRTRHGPDAGHTIESKETAADWTRIEPFLPVVPAGPAKDTTRQQPAA
eukprot:gene10648-biopygen12341